MIDHPELKPGEFDYNKDFAPDNPAHFEAWEKMCPTHIAPDEWQFQLGRLIELLRSKEVKTEHDRSMIMLGWKSQNKLWRDDEASEWADGQRWRWL